MVMGFCSERSNNRMKFNFSNKYFKWGLTAFCVNVACLCFYYLAFNSSAIIAGMKVLWGLIMPIIFGFVIAYLLAPIVNHIEHHFLMPLADYLKLKETPKRNKFIRGMSITMTSCLILTILYLVFAMLFSQIIPSIRNIVMNFDTYINNLTEWLNKILKDNPNMEEYIMDTIRKYSDALMEWVNGNVLDKASSLIKTLSFGVLNVVSVLWNFVIGFIIAVYVLASKEKFTGQAKKIAYAVFERDTANTVIGSFKFTHRTFIGYISGKILDSFLIGLICFAGTTILKTPYAALVSVIIGITNVIPFFGPFIGAIPCSILILVIDPLHPINCIYFVIFIFLLQQFDGNVLGPKILGESTGLGGFWVIFSITLFGGFFGVLGMVIGVPVFAIIYAFIKARVNRALDKKHMTQETDHYIYLEYVDENGAYHQNVPEVCVPKSVAKVAEKVKKKKK